MSNEIQVKLVNEAEVMRDLAAAGLSVEVVMRAAIAAAAEVVQQAAIPLAPGPGIGVNQTADDTAFVGPVKEKWYYRFQETGTVRHFVKFRDKKALWMGAGRPFAYATVGGVAAQPFMRPAVDENHGPIGNAAGEHWQRALENV